MKLFRTKAERELDGILAELCEFLANNYKDQAHAMREKLISRTEELYAAGKLSEKSYDRYKKLCEHYTELMKNYNHREFYHS